MIIITSLLLLTHMIYGQLNIPKAGPSFVSPIDFNPTEENKQKVVFYIERQVWLEFAPLGMGDEYTLKDQGERNLSAFKQLTKVSNKVILSSLIKNCKTDNCLYTDILKRYKEREKKSTLKW